jgi:cytochrome c553
MKTIVKLAAITAIMMLSMNVQAGDVAAGKAKSGTCTSCHGMNGKTMNPNYPNLAGQNANYLVTAIKDYKNGNRKNALMGSMVSALSDTDIDDIAAYYSSLK